MPHPPPRRSPAEVFAGALGVSELVLRPGATRRPPPTCVLHLFSTRGDPGFLLDGCFIRAVLETYPSGRWRPLAGLVFIRSVSGRLAYALSLGETLRPPRMGVPSTGPLSRLCSEAGDRHRNARKKVQSRGQPVPAVRVDGDEDGLDEEREPFEREAEPEHAAEGGHKAGPE